MMRLTYEYLDGSNEDGQEYNGRSEEGDIGVKKEHQSGDCRQEWSIGSREDSEKRVLKKSNGSGNESIGVIL